MKSPNRLLYTLLLLVEYAYFSLVKSGLNLSNFKTRTGLDCKVEMIFHCSAGHPMGELMNHAPVDPMKCAKEEVIECVAG